MVGAKVDDVQMDVVWGKMSVAVAVCDHAEGVTMSQGCSVSHSIQHKDISLCWGTSNIIDFSSTCSFSWLPTRHSSLISEQLEYGGIFRFSVKNSQHCTSLSDILWWSSPRAEYTCKAVLNFCLSLLAVLRVTRYRVTRRVAYRMFMTYLEWKCEQHLRWSEKLA